MTKRLVDIDDEALRAARSTLGTVTIKDTVNAALRSAASPAEQRLAAVAAAFDVLAASHSADADRDRAWH